MDFYADFHIHSKFSRATAKNLDLENLYITAQIKGITVIGTGDFTHPGWWLEIAEKLEPAEEGLLRLKPEIARACDRLVPPVCRQPVRFMLVTEISNIYKKNDRTRKNHNLVFMPHTQAARQFNRRLDAIGNIHSDGRPILGLDARNLLEIVLETAPGGYLVPAHIWTPWFSLLGSKSGFDAVEECFDDLTPHIFALETGLSSDPPMNWRVSSLDRYTLISNSDAHSPAKLGREANRFDTDLSFSAIRDAIEYADPQRFLGTIEFYPEEGKYHVDGHRKCGFSCAPDRTRQLDRLCPQCGKPMTLGVLYRVDALADREDGTVPDKAAPYRNLIPLDDLLSQVLQVGPKSKKVTRTYHQLIGQFGSEFTILDAVPPQDLARCNIPLLDEAVSRMREGRVNFKPGFDGEFGTVLIFDPEERGRLQGQQSLFDNPAPEPTRQAPVIKPPVQHRPQTGDPAPTLFETPQTSGFVLNERQQAVQDHGTGPLLVSAGPGTGKTRTITCRMSELIQRRQVEAGAVLAVTFTNKAANEMRRRLQSMLAPDADLPLVATFHGLCWKLLKEAFEDQAGAIVDEVARRAVLADALIMARLRGHEVSLSADLLLDLIVQAKQRLLRPGHDLSDVAPRAHIAEFKAVYGCYQHLLNLQEMFDFEDLILETVAHLEKDKAWRRQISQRYTHIFVDEFQDINYGQYRLLRAMAPPKANLCVIGDPDQAIYGFRGSDLRYFNHFARDFPHCGHIRLVQNYRSTDTILTASSQVIRRGRRDPLQVGEPERTVSHINGFKSVSVIEAPTARSEAVAIGQIIEQMVGGTGFHSIDFDKLDAGDNGPDRSFADFAVLCRTGRQVEKIAQQLTSATIPCQWVSTRALQQPWIIKLLAAFRVITRQGSYADLGQLNALNAAGVSRETINLFKQWAYGRQLPLATALRSVLRLPIPGMSTRRQQRLTTLVRLLDRLAKECTGLDAAQTLAHIVAQTTLAGRSDGDGLNRVKEMATAFGTDKTGFGTFQALKQDTDVFRSGAEKVAVMTLHAAKGLEFPVVFVAGCEENLLPYRRPGREVDLEEERRLFYVGMTRARDRLFLTWARRRTHAGETRNCQISHFINEIESRLLTRTTAKGRPQAPAQKQLTLF